MTSKISLLLFLAATTLALFSAAHAQPTSNHELRAVPKPRAVTIDGKLDEWDTSGKIFITSDVARLSGKFSAHAAMMYDDEALYVGLDWDDPTPLLNNYDPLIDVDRRFGFHSDSLQIHFKTDVTRQIFGWYYSKEKRPGVVVTEGSKWYSATPITYIDGMAELGITQAFSLKPDGSGYFQEMRIPWTAISRSGRAYRAGESLDVMLDLVWGPDAGKGWPTAHHMDLVAPGAAHTGWFWEVGDIQGKVVLSPVGNVSPAPSQSATPVSERRLAGTIPVRVDIPAAAQRFTIAINDAAGQRVRNLAGDFKPEDYSVAVRGGTRTVQVFWDGLSDKGQPVSPGQYRVLGLSHNGLGATYETTFYNPGTPPWDVRDGSGAWGADHSSPYRVSAAGDWVAIGWEGAEGGSGIIGVGPDGRKKWGEKQGVTSLASDGQFVYFMLNNGWAKQVGLARIDRSSGAYRPYQANGKDEFPLALEAIFAGEVPGEVTALAVHDKTLVLALSGKNGSGGALAVLDAATAKLQKIIEVPVPIGLAFGRDGQLYALLGGQQTRGSRAADFAIEGIHDRAWAGGRVQRVDLATGRATPFLTPGVGQPAAIAVDNDGNVVVADIGPDSQVKAFSPRGGLVYTAGRKGGRPIRGLFDAQAMMRMSSVAVDGKGQVWVTEHWDYPRRVSVWGKNGKLIRDYIGNTGYAGTGAYLHDQNPELAYVGPIEIKLNPKNDTWKVQQILWVPGEGENFPISTGSHNKAQRFTSAASGRPREYLYSAQNAQVVYMPRGKGWQPVAAICQVHHLSGRVRDGKVLAPPTGEFAGLNPLDGVFWNDLNRDGKVQRAECIIVPDGASLMKRSMTDWGRRIGEDLSIFTQGQGITRHKPLRFIDDGAPIYGPQGMQKLGVDEPGDYVPVTDKNLLLALSFKGYSGPTSGMLGIDTRSGQVLWSYPNRYPSVHGSRRAPMSEPGLLVGPLFITGVAQVNSEIGRVFVLRGNLGEDYVLTTDGLFVGALFQDGRLPAGTLPATQQEMRGKSMNDFTLGGESFSGWFGKQSDGKIRTLTSFARQAGLVGQVKGLETIRKFTGPTLSLDANILSRAAADNAARATGSAAAKNYALRRVATAPIVDGDFADWQNVPALAIERENSPNKGTAKLTYDNRNLYLAFDVADSTPFLNEGKDYTRLFKTGDAVDLQLGTNLKPRGAPDAGDLRIVFSRLNGQPVAVLMKPIVPGTAANARVKYHSPVMDKYFDRVEILAAAQVAVKTSANGYRVEAALPWNALGIEPKAGLVLRGDAGIISSDAEGLTNVARTYWSNKDTNLVSDLPQESWLYPNTWGQLNFQ